MHTENIFHVNDADNIKSIITKYIYRCKKKEYKALINVHKYIYLQYIYQLV